MKAFIFLKLLTEFNKEKKDRIAVIYNEGEELLKIVVTSLNTLRKGHV
jgi:hypothetical protein